VAAGLAIAAGTYVGGWRIMKTLGQRVCAMEPPDGFAAQVSAGTVLFGASHFGFPVSTPQCISGAVMGAGAMKRFSAVRWGVAGNIVFAWLLTIRPLRSSRVSSFGRSRHCSRDGERPVRGT
jgi:PiT family inorganic phosphate transporter